MTSIRDWAWRLWAKRERISRASMPRLSVLCGKAVCCQWAAVTGAGSWSQASMVASFTAIWPGAFIMLELSW